MSIDSQAQNLNQLISKSQTLVNSQVFRRVEVIVLSLVLAILCIQQIDTIPFFADEATWIHYSSYFDVLVSGDFSASTWSGAKPLIDQPPLAWDLIGLGRWVGRQGGLTGAWNYTQGYSYNLAQGAVPTPQLLWWSRLPMAVIGAVTGILIFLGIRWAAGRLAAYLWLIFYCVSPFMTSTMGRAMAESPLLAAITVAVMVGGLAFYWLVKALTGLQIDPVAYKRSLLGWALMGIAAGLATAAKLNGAVVLLTGLVACLAVLAPRGLTIRWPARVSRVVLAVAVLMGAGALTFVLINPFLYRDPIGHSWMMVTHRNLVMAGQARAYASDYISTWADRLRIVPDEVFNQHAFGQFPGSFWLNLGLSAVGLGVLLWAARLWQTGQPTAVSSFMIIAAALTVAVPPLFTPLNWDRYYLLPVVAARIFTVVAVAKIFTKGPALLLCYLRNRQHPIPVS